MIWDDQRNAELRRMSEAGWKLAAMASALGSSRGRVIQQRAKLGLPALPRGPRCTSEGKRLHPSGGKLRRFSGIKPGGRSIRLTDDHAAIVEGRTLFPSTVVDVANSPRVFVSGANQRKIGKKVVKGRWRGMPIYCVTLEERATCPKSCAVWNDCYGNNMHLARRHRHGEALEHRIIDEALELARIHPGGFVVRLHILGDFYSTEYVELWHELMKLLPALHLFGFTAHKPDSDVGRAILGWLRWSNEETDARAWVRFSGTDAFGLGSLVIDRLEDSKHVVCPAQTGATDCCGTCGLCWTMDKPVEFKRH
jgi:hypothetical protein